MSTKKKLFHLLNARARREENEKAQREEELYQAWATDPRRSHGHDMSRVYPLIEDER